MKLRGLLQVIDVISIINLVAKMLICGFCCREEQPEGVG